MVRMIEALIDSDISKKFAELAALGRAKRIEGVRDRYIEFAKRTLPRGFTLNGMRVVIDCEWCSLPRGPGGALGTRCRRYLDRGRAERTQHQ